jgi:hypothetical protein
MKVAGGWGGVTERERERKKEREREETQTKGCVMLNPNVHIRNSLFFR